MQDQPNKLHLCSVFTRDLQINRSSSISTGIKREVLLELSHKIKDEKSHDLFSANWRTSNAGGIIQHDFKGPCFPSGSDVKASACKAGDPGSIPGPGRSPGEGNGNLHQYSHLDNSTDGGAWWAPPTAHGVAMSRKWLSDFTFFFTKAQEPRMLMPKGRRWVSQLEQRTSPPSSVFGLFKPSVNWMVPTQVGEGSLLYPVY